MSQYTVWSNASDEKTISASDPRDAASRYHETIGTMPERWDGVIHVRDAHGEEWSYRYRKAA